jgi:hypothetical protein
MNLYADLIIADNQQFNGKFYKFFPLEKQLLIIHRWQYTTENTRWHKLFDYKQINKITFEIDGGD